MMKSLVAASMMLAMLFGGNAAFANGANEKAKNGATKKVAAKHPKTVRISVSKDGFSPSTINVEKGHLLNLVFFRADNKGCGTEVVFPSLNIRKKLPLKKNVTIQITLKEAGEINFSCGMNMYKGTIIAE